MSDNVVVVGHPLVQHKLSLMRDKSISTGQFRRLLQEIAPLMLYEATRDLPLTTREVETPLARLDAPVLAGKKLCFVPILRAGLGFLDSMLDLVPSARVGHIGLYRDPTTLDAIEYYLKLPEDVAQRLVILVDPMLATGHSASAAIHRLKDLGAEAIKFICLVAAPAGIATVHADHPEVPIFAAAVDVELNDHGYIVPGLGDAGDRLFGTK
jgi:uracil phosphoribosyltransferase